MAFCYFVQFSQLFYRSVILKRGKDKKNVFVGMYLTSLKLFICDTEDIHSSVLRNWFMN